MNKIIAKNLDAFISVKRINKEWVRNRLGLDNETFEQFLKGEEKALIYLKDFAELFRKNIDYFYDKDFKYKVFDEFIEENSKLFDGPSINIFNDTDEIFVITYENEIYQQWSSEFVFSEFTKAKEYLLNNGFIEKNRLFERTNHNWSSYLKAYITPKYIKE